MKTIFLPLKISPSDVIPLLQIIEENGGDRKKIEESTREYYKKSSKKFTTPHHNPFRTRVVHSLRKLRLLQGENQNIVLTDEGKYLYSISENLEKYKKQLARILLQLDNEKCRILNIFQEINQHMRYQDLVKELYQNGITVKKTDDKLRRWLQFLSYCEILQYVPPIYHFNSHVVEALKNTKLSITPKNFKKILYEEYEKIKKNKGITYVSIPDIKNAILPRLKNKGYTPLDFKEQLINIMTDNPDKKITLSETGLRRIGGIFYNNTYYYFLNISKK